ncbi:hypothetical protein KEG38_27485 [Polyangium jinanense]|uniref:hypothetical protein n=1 Tax=Polyangium jinanense TaxID=2829994 RepID=UPI002340EEB4|nr:hypothetical protein [Polyangium jinanense]MDC3957632.1 hypothetical protein [Polyangium jinanense]
MNVSFNRIVVGAVALLAFTVGAPGSASADPAPAAQCGPDVNGTNVCMEAEATLSQSVVEYWVCPTRPEAACERDFLDLSAGGPLPTSYCDLSNPIGCVGIDCDSDLGGTWYHCSFSFMGNPWFECVSIPGIGWDCD